MGIFDFVKNSKSVTPKDLQLHSLAIQDVRMGHHCWCPDGANIWYALKEFGAYEGAKLCNETVGVHTAESTLAWDQSLRMLREFLVEVGCGERVMKTILLPTKE